MPQASRMRPTSMASAGNSAASRASAIKPVLGGLLGGSLLDQAFHGGGSLGAHALPVGQAVLGDTDAFFLVGGDRVVETDALDEVAVTTAALVSHNNVEEGASLGAAAGKSDHDHDLSLVDR